MKDVMWQIMNYELRVKNLELKSRSTGKIRFLQEGKEQSHSRPACDYSQQSASNEYMRFG